MKIKQLGNGGAFDYDKTNSSFLIDIGTSEKRSLILFVKLSIVTTFPFVPITTK